MPARWAPDGGHRAGWYLESDGEDQHGEDQCPKGPVTKHLSKRVDTQVLVVRGYLEMRTFEMNIKGALTQTQKEWLTNNPADGGTTPPCL